MHTEVGGGGGAAKSFFRNCGAASVGEYNKVIWFYQLTFRVLALRQSEFEVGCSQW